MSKKKADPRRVRRLAMQALYQMDVTGTAEHGSVFEGLDEEYDPVEVREAAARLAVGAWADHAEADALMQELAPDWPTHRQPPVDRAILRLAFHEVRSGRAPTRVVLNEAVELARQFGSEHSPAFINGVLDKAARRITPAAQVDGGSPRVSDEQWLGDALEE